MLNFLLCLNFLVNFLHFISMRIKIYTLRSAVSKILLWNQRVEFKTFFFPFKFFIRWMNCWFFPLFSELTYSQLGQGFVMCRRTTENPRCSCYAPVTVLKCQVLSCSVKSCLVFSVSLEPQACVFCSCYGESVEVQHCHQLGWDLWQFFFFKFFSATE